MPAVIALQRAEARMPIPSKFQVACSSCNLRELCLPGKLGVEDLARVENIVYARRRLKRGESVFKAGGEFSAVYAIRSGFFKSSVVDGEGREVEPGTVGELIVRGVPGVTLMKGYFKNATATAETLRDGWLWSGDYAWMDDEGYFYFVDRKKDMLKRAGENVSASEVEETLKQHPGVFDAAVVGVPDPLRDQAIKAYVILHAGATVTATELIAWCAERLSPFKVPEAIELRDSFPRTSVGKIQKHLF